MLLEHKDITKPLILLVSKKAVKRKDIKYHSNLFNELDRNAKDYSNGVTLLFEGYDEDQREIYQIPEVRKWVKLLLNKVPHLFYYLCDFTESITMIYLCVAKIKNVSAFRNRKNCEMEFESELRDYIIEAVYKYSLSKKHTEIETIIICERVIKAMGTFKIN
ncbi:hypothetical protein ACQCVK_10605 [Rossellomorea vietnamensis]|uniref:hypothetical protein n=1 Tax=Rossellomorea vietnamensis TaxID=218284 RepID=UPI003CF388BB